MELGLRKFEDMLRKLAQTSQSKTANPAQADNLISVGDSVKHACASVGISTSAYYRWREANIRHVFLYGSLRRGENGFKELSLEKYLKFVSIDSIMGQLYDLGNYPGLKIATDEPVFDIKGDIFTITDGKVVDILDKFERYIKPGRPRKAEKSLYCRTLVTTVSHGLRAWTYVFSRKLADAPLIRSGDWVTHRKGR